MTEDAADAQARPQPGAEPGPYCRQVEDYLTRANAGHLVRIVGPGFDIVRQWADEGIPLSVVFRGIDGKVARHHAGRSHRPVRIEFCEADVREVYDSWRRAVGLGGRDAPPTADEGAGPAPERRRPSLARYLDRAIERIGLATGRLDLPEALRDALGQWLEELVALREAAKQARGQARDELARRLAPLDRRMGTVAREAASAELMEDLRREAERDLEPFRSRLSGEMWQRAVDATIDRLVRDRFGLPVLDAPVWSTESEAR
jgi:hypothetical protein